MKKIMRNTLFVALIALFIGACSPYVDYNHGVTLKVGEYEGELFESDTFNVIKVYNCKIEDIPKLPVLGELLILKTESNSPLNIEFYDGDNEIIASSNYDANYIIISKKELNTCTENVLFHLLENVPSSRIILYNELLMDILKRESELKGLNVREYDKRTVSIISILMYQCKSSNPGIEKIKTQQKKYLEALKIVCEDTGLGELSDFDF